MFSRSRFYIRTLIVIRAAVTCALALAVALATMKAVISSSETRARRFSFEDQVTAQPPPRAQTAYISDIDRFLEQCPTNDPAIGAILKV